MIAYKPKKGYYKSGLSPIQSKKTYVNKGSAILFVVVNLNREALVLNASGNEAALYNAGVV